MTHPGKSRGRGQGRQVQRGQGLVVVRGASSPTWHHGMLRREAGRGVRGEMLRVVVEVRVQVLGVLRHHGRVAAGAFRGQEGGQGWRWRRRRRRQRRMSGLVLGPEELLLVFQIALGVVQI